MKKFNTFEGVFTPTILSILGVIMYLRLGWVVGEVGLGCALFIIIFANLITLATALSMSSIITNIRIGAGGAYSIIVKSLGVEAGGAIGIPLYLSQAVSVAFYITGFSECWIFIFPSHNVLLVALFAWFAVTLVSYLSTRMAFRLQYVIMAAVGLSLVSVFLGKGNISAGQSPLWVGLSSGNIWHVFAIFFPAVTGVLAGATMSGELKDPRTSIPKGTLWAIAVSFCIYILLSFWFFNNVPVDELVRNPFILMGVSRWRGLVVAGIMGATISSALTMSVGSPRTLMALGRHSIVPFSTFFARTNKKGEPAVAILFTALLSFVTLIFGTLDTVATLLTMFFLIAYGMINLSVFIEQAIGIASFRPTFSIPRFVSFLGALGCIGVMFLINIKFSIIAFALIIVIYILLLRRGIKGYYPDVRSGLLIFMAEQFAKAAGRLPYHPKIWKPNLLVMIENTEVFTNALPFIKSIVLPAGRVFFFKIIKLNFKGSNQLQNSDDARQDSFAVFREKERDRILSIITPLKEDGLFVGASVIEADDFCTGSAIFMQAAKDMFLPPNTFFYILTGKKEKDPEIFNLIKKTSREGFGVIILKFYSEAERCQEKTVNVWIRRQSPNLDLSILIALQLKNNWDGHARIIQAVSSGAEAKEAREYLEKLKKLMRLPLGVELIILVGDFMKVLHEAPDADINIFGMPEEPDFELIRNTSDSLRTPVLFLRDSKHESAIA